MSYHFEEESEPYLDAAIAHPGYAQAHQKLQDAFGECKWVTAKEEPLNNWSAPVFMKIPLSPFCRGRGGKRWIDPMDVTQELAGFGLTVKYVPGQPNSAADFDGTLYIAINDTFFNVFENPQARFHERTLPDYLESLRQQSISGIVHANAARFSSSGEKAQGR